MSVTVVTRPIGHKLSETPNVATITSSYSGVDGFFVKANHGLVDGDYIYATSDIEDYNGFWYVDEISADAFKLKEGPGADFLQWVADGSITYYVSTEQHGWSCVHLPIVYKLTNDLWPTNTANTARTVSSFTDADGYVNLNLSGILNGTVNDLDYLKISGAADDTLNGVFQITDAVSTSDVTINLAYDAGYSFAGATVQYYYNNYHVRVKVYGGLASDHQYEYLKPYRELAELRLIPDENNEVMFSVNEYLKELINTRNNLLLASLPCNLDFFTQFYISYADSFDISDGTTIESEVGSYTSDGQVPVWTTESLPTLDLWTESGVGEEWTDTATPFVQLSNTQGSENKEGAFAFVDGVTYRFNYSIFVTSLAGVGITTRTAYITIEGAGSESEIVNLSLGANTRSFQFTAVTGMNAVRIRVDQTVVGSHNYEYQINSATLESRSFTGFDGYAANAKLPFKNQYSGFLSEYIEGKWLTNQVEPEIFDGQYFDLSAIVNQEGDIQVLINGDLSDTIEGASPGIYRIPITATGEDMTVQLQIDGVDITDEITLLAHNECGLQSIYLTWLNNLGGFDYLEFTAKKDHIVEIQEAGITTQNIFPSWPQSYGSIADTIRKQTFRTSNKAFTIRSQHLTAAQLDAVAYIKSSVLVQILVSRTDRRTVIVDTDSFVIRKDGDDTYAIAFNISYTDDIPVQTV